MDEGRDQLRGPGRHMLLRGGSQRPWKDEKRDSRLVFIGRGLPMESSSKN